MSVLEIRKYPDRVLKRKSALVDEIDTSIVRLAGDMVETMYAANGLGLAAPQVGVLKRLIVIDRSHIEGEVARVLVLVNPEIVSREGAVAAEEGCLSLPDFVAEVDRAERVVVKGLDLEGNETTITAEGLLARALQHEIDHIDGTLLLDRAGFLKREFYKKRFRKSREKDE